MTDLVRPTPGKRPHAALALAALATALVLSIGAPPAGSAPNRPTQATGGWVRLGHFAPARGAVDLVVDGKVVARAVTFRAVSPYVRVGEGTHRFQVVPAGKGAAAEPLLELTAGVPADKAVTVAAVAARKGLAGQVYDDRLAPPPAGQALVRFIHASPAVAAVDIGVVDGPDLATGVAYPKASAYEAVPAGSYDIHVDDAAGGTELLRVAGWVAAAGTQNTVVVVEGADGKPDVVPFSDSSGTGTMPSGGMATGFGGLARDAGPPTGRPWWVVPALTAAAAAVGAEVMRRRAGPARRPALALATLGTVGSVLAGCGHARSGSAGPVVVAERVSDTPVLTTPTTLRRATTSSVVATGPTTPAGAPVRPGANVNRVVSVGEPRAVTIERIGVRSGLERLGLAADGTAEVPADPKRAGWFTGGPRPGDPGPAVIAGHVDTKTGPAVFARLHELRPGDEATVDTATGPVVFVVERVEQVAKDRFPTVEVYGPAPGHQLRLVTCGGSFDRESGHYLDNVVVFLVQQAP